MGLFSRVFGSVLSRMVRRPHLNFQILGVLIFAGLPVSSVCADEAPLPKTAAEALKWEAVDDLPITAFYETPADFSTTKPGALLRKETVRNYALPNGATAVRILYHSLDAEGRDVVTSAAVLIPRGAPPKGGWPVIAWAHGTSGVARICAPSAMKDVYYGDEGLMPMVAAGFAVVATDYHGLGTAGFHQYLDTTAQARDVIYSIPAARAAVPTLGRRWVVDGHSQGGMAAWTVVQQESASKDADFLGAVSVAGAISRSAFLGHSNETKGAGFYMSYMAFGIKARYPEFRPEDMLTPAALAHYQDVTTKGCWLYGYATYAGADIARMLKPSWSENPWVKRFMAGDSPDTAALSYPLFVIGGEADHSVPISQIRATVADACRRGFNIYFRSYAGLDHDPVMEKSTPDQLAWIRERFGGKPAQGNCS